MTGCSSSDVPEDRGAAIDVGISLEPITSIGCADCDDSRQITPTAIALLGEERTVLLDQYEPFVRVFGPQGEPLAAFGGKGEGPGEMGLSAGTFYIPGTFVIPGPGEEISVVDVMPPVLETFDADGTFLRQQALGMPGLVPSGQAYSSSARAYFRISRDPFSDRGDTFDVCRLVSGEEADCSTFATVEAIVGNEDDRPGEGSAGARLAVAAKDDGGIVVADTGASRFWIVDASGAVSHGFDHQAPRAPKTDDELERERAANEGRLARGLAEREIDPLRPPMELNGVQVDGAGRIWVLSQRHVDDRSEFDVFDATGNFLAVVGAAGPIRAGGFVITPFTVLGDRLATVVQLPDGEARIDVYSIVER